MKLFRTVNNDDTKIMTVGCFLKMYAYMSMLQLIPTLRLSYVGKCKVAKNRNDWRNTSSINRSQPALLHRNICNLRNLISLPPIAALICCHRCTLLYLAYIFVLT